MIYRTLAFLMGFVLAHPQTVEIRFNEHNQPIVPNVTIPGLYRSFLTGENDSTFDVSLSMACNTEIDLGPSDAFNSSEFNGTMLTSENFELNRGDRIPFQGDETDIIVGIGPGSFLLRNYEEITMIRNGSQNGYIIFNDTNATQFNRSCSQESISNISGVRNSHSSTFHMSTYSRLVWPTSGRTVNQNRRFHLTRLSDENHILSLPNELGLEIHDILLTSGAVLNSGQFEATNCVYATLIGQLPQIALRFLLDTQSELILYPEDYIKFDREANTCTLEFERAEEGTHSLYINPLVIPEVNVHITRDGFDICDSQNQ